MATVTALKFPTVEGAIEALQVIEGLQQEHLIKVHDAAVVSWPAGKQSPRTRHLASLGGADALSGMFWGMLLGCVFLTPLFGLAIGAAVGAMNASFRDYGISEDFIQRVRTRVTEGTSAIFLMTSEAVLDRVAEAMKGIPFEIIATN